MSAPFTKSIRFRLTLWYVGVLAIVLTAFSMCVYYALARQIQQHANEALINSVDMFSRTLRHEIEENQGGPMAEQHYREVINEGYKDTYPELGIAVYAGARLVIAKPGPGAIVPPVPQHLDPRIRLVDVRGKAGAPERRASVLLHIGNFGDYSIVSSMPMRHTAEELDVLRGTFWIAVPLALAAVAFGGWLLARKSLQPVVAISETARRISSKDLHRRVAVSNPDDELGRLAIAFNELLERLEKSFEQQKQFMADCSHELRTPVYVASTCAQVTLQRASCSEAEYRDALETVDRHMKRLSRLVENMFLLARADAGVYPMELHEFYLDEAVSECARAANLLGSRTGTRVIAHADHEAVCRGDDGLIRQLIMILLENAVKHSGPNSLVEARLEDDVPGVYSVVVRDNGPGIPEPSRHSIFDRFFRVDRSRARTNGDPHGAGLGLAIGKWIAELHGGSLTLESSSSSGSVFRATFRRQPPAASEEPSASQDSAAEPAVLESADQTSGVRRT